MTQRILPLRGAANPSTRSSGTNPGSFANALRSSAAPRSSPHRRIRQACRRRATKTAWDFHAGWLSS